MNLYTINATMQIRLFHFKNYRIYNLTHIPTFCFVVERRIEFFLHQHGYITLILIQYTPVLLLNNSIIDCNQFIGNEYHRHLTDPFFGRF